MDPVDALDAAGYARCPVCGARGYPLDAVWLGDGLLVASYSAPCEHAAEARVWLVDVERLERV